MINITEGMHWHCIITEVHHPQPPLLPSQTEWQNTLSLIIVETAKNVICLDWRQSDWKKWSLQSSKRTLTWGQQSGFLTFHLNAREIQKAKPEGIQAASCCMLSLPGLFFNPHLKKQVIISDSAYSGHISAGLCMYKHLDYTTHQPLHVMWSCHTSLICFTCVVFAFD